MNRFFILILLIFTAHNLVSAQSKNLVYVDKQGVLRWTKDRSEASFFGVNYTVPFAYGYRSHKVLGADMEKAIEADVYHMWRLGLNAFRVHIWDVEITDSLGNLLQNEHLRLFDYLLFQLKKRNIKILLTPIAFWGNGYPEPDIKTNGFSYVYGKGNSVVLEAPIKAQENYMKQIMCHVNPYTKLSYRDDPDIIAAEINNEPHHSGPKERTTEYVNRLAAAIRSTGWTKPVFYNISESPNYADAVAKSQVEGFSFQWYPTGLVAGRELQGNYLPHVDRYAIPFIDTIPAFQKGTRVVYEFDAGDVLQSNMYPAMARSFRSAGFQWATQFAYDPMATAFANTEYQTHYLNLAYTPSKAISLLIASKAFQMLPRLKKYGTYPADTLFDVFRVSYRNNLSEMNSNEEFYYSNNTNTQPRNISRLQHIAGVGSSPVVQYSGSGVYFIDRMPGGNWRLEIMPDAIRISDPFAKASLKKEVTKISWQSHNMTLQLPDLGQSFFVRGVNEGNNYASDVNGSFSIPPGVYELAKNSNPGIISNDPGYHEFFAPLSHAQEQVFIHTPVDEVSAGQSFPISVKLTGLDSIEKVMAELRPATGRWTTVQLTRSNKYDYSGMVPENAVKAGLMSYRIFVQKKNNDYIIYPGGIRNDHSILL